jgi:hypothetical protein
MTTKSVPRVPSYRRHEPTGQAVVTLEGHDIYLGQWNTATSRIEYDRLIGEWLAAGRRLPHVADSQDTTIIELGAAYWRFAQGYYRKDGQRYYGLGPRICSMPSSGRASRTSGSVPPIGSHLPGPN